MAVRWAVGLLTAGAVAAGAAFAYKKYGRADPHANLPMATAKKGEFLVIVSSRGELVADRSVQITAPNVPDLRLVWQAPQGTAAKKDELLLRFDASGAKRQLQEKEAALNQAQAALAQAVAHGKITEEQDKLELASTRHAVERAKLEVKKAETVSRLQAEESQIDLGLAQEKMNVQQAAMNLNKASAASKVASLTAQRDKALAEADLLKRRISQMEVKAPAEGVVNYMMNYSQGWMNAKPFKTGDQVWPGSSVAELPDLTSLQMKAKVEEIERGRLLASQMARIYLDPFPEKPFQGKLIAISPLAEQNFEWPPSRNFRAFASIDQTDNRLRPGMNGRLDIVVDRIPDAISVPSKAVFARHGKPMVLVPGPNGMKSVTVEVVARNPDEVAVKGIEAGTQVALVEAGERKQEATAGGKTGSKPGDKQ